MNAVTRDTIEIDGVQRDPVETNTEIVTGPLGDIPELHVLSGRKSIGDVLQESTAIRAARLRTIPRSCC